ncbi:hypothetical protein [Rhodopirellula halodulae]|uniref:hypothetical protein n=1 Tax=Rhodopirellula halodulae TaxID=2894198 RepID=UPI001E2D7974|nr:hypothetical protein [Rhodopirellula sp. JC737]MCC9654542.1 hypothetical protein [Rhodopirellula sp. JC737]
MATWFLARAQPGWVWVPSQYYWTPRGCVYRAGYWDYDLPNRGIVFTPVHFRDRVYTRPNYVYRPRYTIDTTAALLVNLFLRPATNRYYFGDYYGRGYANNYYPWVNYGQRSRAYDPLFAYYSTRGVGRNATTLDWINRRYNYFATNDGLRPPRTVAAQRQFLRNNLEGNANVDTGILRVAAVADNLTSLANDGASGMRLQRLQDSQLEDVRRQIRQSTNELVNRRREIELQTDTNADVDSNAASANTEANAEARGTLELPDSVNALAGDDSNGNRRNETRREENALADAISGSDGERDERSMRDAGGELRERFEARREQLEDAAEDSADRAGQAIEDTGERLERSNQAMRGRLQGNREDAEDLGRDENIRDSLNGARRETAERAGDAVERPDTNRPMERNPLEDLRNGLDGNRGGSQASDLQQRLQQLRQEGRARPERPSDWPGRQPRSDRGNGLPDLPRRGSQSVDPTRANLPGVGDALNRGVGNLPGLGTPDNGRRNAGGNRGGGNGRGANAGAAANGGGANRGGGSIGGVIGGALGGD